MMKLKFSKDNVNKKLIFVSPESIKENPFASRQQSSTENYQELYESIRDNGILQPIIVKKSIKFSDYEVISGQRRLEICKKLKYKQIPCIEIEATDFQSCLFSLIENICRHDLHFFEEARAIDLMQKQWCLTQSETAQLLSMSQPTLSNKLRLLRLSATEQRSIENMKLSERHARALITIKDDKLREQALNEIIIKNLNVEQSEKYIASLLEPPHQKPHAKIKSGVVKDLKIFINSINKAVKTMQSSGINAKTETNETDDYISYTVIIPKIKETATE